ncbi:uncharacterized protein ACIBXB_016197 [Morphnus guianensis]
MQGRSTPAAGQREIPVNTRHHPPQTLQKLGLGPCVIPGCSPRGEGGLASKGRGVAQSVFGTDESFQHFQFRAHGPDTEGSLSPGRQAGSEEAEPEQSPGLSERKMKVLLTLAVLFACSVFTAHGKLPRMFTPGLEGSTVGNLTAYGCYSGWGSSGTLRASVDRCCLLRACCYAKLAARRCRVGPIQPLLVPRARIPTCRKLWDLVPERCLQMRAGSLALPDAQPGAAPASRQVPGTRRAVLKQKGSLQNHLQADK